MVEPPSSADLFRRMDGLQQHLRDLLKSNDPRYAVRPPTGKWSVVENLCHLLFAEQSHLGPYLSDPQQWSPFALPPHGMQKQARFRDVGQPASRSELVLVAWAEIHEPMRRLATNDDQRFQNRLDRHVKHLNAHVKVIERLLRTQEKATS